MPHLTNPTNLPGNAGSWHSLAGLEFAHQIGAAGCTGEDHDAPDGPRGGTVDPVRCGTGARVDVNGQERGQPNAARLVMCQKEAPPPGGEWENPEVLE